MHDFIIVGAGSAGCVLTDRLSANGRYQVLVLEAGGSDRRFYIQMPLGYGKTFYDPSLNWMYQAEADPGLGGRKDYWPRGKVLGGSSAINAMAEVAIDVELEKMKTELVSAEELQKVKNKTESMIAFEDMSVMNRANSLAYYELLGDAAWMNFELEKYGTVTTDDILQESRTIFRNENSNTIYYQSNN